MSDISKKTRKEVISRDGLICKYCGDDLKEQKFILDHVVSRSKGGSGKSDNLVVSCVKCNGFKSDLSVETFSDKAFERCLFHYTEFTYWKKLVDRFAK